MIYELRVYSCLPGKLPAVLKRFDDVVLGFWKKYGIRPVGFWTVALGESSSKLFYMLSWESLAEREAKWPAFVSDTEWHKARDKSERGGPLVADISTTILQPTAFSGLK